jgi:predicted nucleic acid-binding protein
MLYSSDFTAFLDANVLYPAPIRDILLFTADQDLYRVKWSDEVNDEWSRNLLKNRKDLTRESVKRTIDNMNLAFEDANVKNYKRLIPTLQLPDSGDAHVLAAAIKCRADVIVTCNLKHFPNKILAQYNMEAVHPDEFLINLLDMDQESFLAAFHLQVAHLKNPPRTELQVLMVLSNAGLTRTVEAIKKCI